MAVPPPSARATGVLFERRPPLVSSRSQSTPEGSAEIFSPSGDRLFDFESELEGNLTYIPLAVRFKLDQSGLKLSLEAWQRLPELGRGEFLRMPCDSKEGLDNYRTALCALVTEYCGEEPGSIPIVEHPPWANDRVPDQLIEAAMALGFSAPSAAQWCGLSALQRFALVKLSRKGREPRNLGAALREFGLLKQTGA